MEAGEARHHAYGQTTIGLRAFKVCRVSHSHPRRPVCIPTWRLEANGWCRASEGSWIPRPVRHRQQTGVLRDRERSSELREHKALVNRES